MIQRAAPDPFRFGWREVTRPGRNGRLITVRQPLTPDDLLHPQEHDVIVQNTAHERDCRYLASVLESRLAERTHILVLVDLLIDWGVAGLGNHAPDICVVDEVRDRDRVRKIFRMAKEGARPLLVIEIVSPDDYDPRVRDNDVVTKVEHYYRAGVPLYVVVDWEDENGPRQLRGYWRGKRRYVALPLDAQGRLLLEPVGLLLGLRDNRVVCFDAVTGEEIPNHTGMARARQQAEQARQAEAQARQQAEQARQAEAQARQQAEQARQQAEQARQAEAQARQQVEAALTAAQARIRELESQASRRRPPRGNGP